ncbi:MULTISPECIES: DUF4190 domain-containing protein [Streptomyces]|uniref:DUF4190 domain-containing protein n=1 Tax=Streptomyces TaxID=1883 RepID=UPI001CCE910C|nr:MULTISPECIES: DUF4190 domain-containing protein [Streptomyces]MBZ6172302.1 DUF4190 domain-containing protein [Streptomyces olivaceus]MBZ6178813.1 DUF4190 domain-containing protein [Streptomyces olivaceus]MCM8549063.1 DUF4190 domain-containing protein [Streptomyces sp. STCH 565 A]
MSTPPQPGPQGPHAQGPHPAGQHHHPPQPHPNPYPHPEHPHLPSQPYPYAYPQPGPWGQPYGSHGGRPGEARLSGLAVAAFVLGILCFVPAVGLVLGLVALARIRKRGERGKGFAVAGSVLSCVGLALWAALLSTGAAGDFWDGFRDAARGEGTAYALEKGQCFTTPSGSLQGVTYDVDEVPCAQKHDGEVFASFELPRGSFPGDTEISRAADDRCYALQDGYAMDRWALPADVDVYYLTPTSGSWRTGDREITCLFGNTDERADLTGSLRNDGARLDADQHTYLLAEGHLNRAMDRMPGAAAVEDDLAAYRIWAGQVAEALRAETTMLDRHRWPGGAERPVTELVRDLETARDEWGLAAKATDADTYYAHYGKGYDLLAADTTVTAREALGLATTPPDHEAGGEDGGGGGDDPGLKV